VRAVPPDSFRLHSQVLLASFCRGTVKLLIQRQL
jgi:hypothetical protein